MTRRFDQMQMQAALDKQALRADAEQRLLEEKMQRARLETQIRELEGKSYEDIAEITGCRLGTVKSRLNRARNKFATLISPLIN